MNGPVRRRNAPAAGALAHIQNVGALIGESLKISDLQRLEVPGSAVELEQMKAPLKDLPVVWFTFEVALEK